MAGAPTMAVMVKQTPESTNNNYAINWWILTIFFISFSMRGCTLVSLFTEEAERALEAMVGAHPITVAKTRTRQNTNVKIMQPVGGFLPFLLRLFSEVVRQSP